MAGSSEILTIPRPHIPWHPQCALHCACGGAGLKIERYPKHAISPSAPWWLNLTLNHIYKLPEPHAWTKFNIKTMAQLVSNQSLAPLSKLISDFNVQQSYFFHYLQFSHAFNCHFTHSPPQVVQSALEDLLRLDCTKKPTFQLYSFGNDLPSCSGET